MSRTSKGPELKVRSFLRGVEEKATICDLEQIKKYFDYECDAIVVVEGVVVGSYEKLVKMVTQYSNKQLFEVVILPFIAGG